MLTKKFEDGTEFTPAHFAVALSIGAALAGTMIFANEKWVAFRTKRIMKKNNWPT
jgi:hypothetical protein